MTLPTEINDLIQAFLNGLNDALNEKLYGVYLYGAITFPESGALTDIDFHVILTERLSHEERAKLQSLHASLKHAYPPLGGELDGYYILLEDARKKSPPETQMIPGVIDASWALHREHIRSGRCIVLQGPDPLEVYPATSWDELSDALQGELTYVRDHLNDYQAYCVLNLCRLMYSFETRNVVASKYGSAAWAINKYPDWKSLIDAAVRFYEKIASQDDCEMLKSEVGNFFDFACERIRKET